MTAHSFALSVAALAILALGASSATAEGKTKAAQEVADYVLRRFGKEAAKDGAEALTRRLERAAIAHGDDVFKAVRVVGPRGLHLIEEAGAHSKQVAKVLARYGEPGAVFVVSRRRAMQLFLQHGEEAAAVLVSTRGVAEPAIEAFGKPAIGAFQSIAKPRNARRLAMMAAEGAELSKMGRTPEVLGVLAKYGDPALEFVWRHKVALASAAVLAAFLADPGPFITGARDITQIVAENAVKPVAEVPAVIAKESAGGVARRTNWTLIFLASIAVGTLLVVARWWRFRPLRQAVEPAPRRGNIAPGR